MKPRASDVAPLPPGAVIPPMLPSSGSKENPADLEEVTDAAPSDQPRHRFAQTNTATRSSQRVRRTSSSSADRFQSINHFVDIAMRNLSDRAAKAWLVLWRDTKPNGVARTAISDLARRMGCSIATAKRAVAELRKLRLLEIDSRGGLGRGPSTYRLTSKANPP